MATWDDVASIARSLPDVDQHQSRGRAMWRVRGKGFVWERPLRVKDRQELGDRAPSGDILGVRVADEGVKQALVAQHQGACFTISHFDGYPAVLIRLAEISVQELTELVVDAWLDRAPARLAVAYLAEHPQPGGEGV